MLRKIIEGVGISLIGGMLDEKLKMHKTSNKSELDIIEWSNLYNCANKLLYNLNSEMYEKNRTPDRRENVYELMNDCVYTLNYKNIKIKVITYKPESKGYYQEQHLKIEFVGKEKHKARNIFIKKMKNLKDSDKIEVHSLGEVNVILEQIPRTWDTVILNKDKKIKIINGLKNWKRDKSWYEEHELVHKIGVLLYGQAGTGKSTIVKAISTMFNNAPIFTIDTKNPMNSISELVRKRKRTNDVMIVLLEDFDMYFQNRAETDVDKVRSMEVQNIIFQLLDGVYSTEDTIYIATTNYIERLDSALIRSGRFDIKEELPFLTKEECLSIVKNFGYDSSVLDKMNIEYPCQPSYIQSMIMEYRAKEMVK